MIPSFFRLMSDRFIKLSPVVSQFSCSLGLECGVDVGSLVVDDGQQEVSQVSADISVGNGVASIGDGNSGKEILVDLVHGLLLEEGLENSEALILPEIIVPGKGASLSGKVGDGA